MTLLQKAFGFDLKYGGRQIAMIGRQGTRKTTILRAYAENALARKQPVIWRARKFKDQWHLIPSEPNVISPEGFDISFWEAPQGTLDRKERTFNIQKFTSTRQIMSLLQPGLNVLIEPNLPRPWLAVWWVYFLDMLVRREKYPSIRVCFDEILDVFPSSTMLKSDAYGELMPNFAARFYDLRRFGIDMMMVGHNSGDVHFDIRGAFTGIIYLPGAQAIKHWKVSNRALDALRDGRCIVELPGKYVETSMNIPDDRQPTSYISHTMDDDNWPPDPAFKDASRYLLNDRLVKKYRYWNEPRKVKIEKKEGPGAQKGEGIPPINSSKITRKRGKKAAPPAKRGG